MRKLLWNNTLARFLRFKTKARRELPGFCFISSLDGILAIRQDDDSNQQV
jgi:hypothetical protein